MSQLTDVVRINNRKVRARPVEVSAGHVLYIYESEELDDIFDEAITHDEPAPYGLILWASAIGLARELKKVGCLTGVKVLELGTGNGLGALTAASMGAQVVATDIHPFTLQLVSEAAKHQGFANLETLLVDIEDETPLPECDLVIGADLLYEPELAVHVARRCFEAIERRASLLFADPDRLARKRFVQELAVRHIDVLFSPIKVQEEQDKKPAKIGIWKHGRIFSRIAHE
jgi:predicted nicotinamide N-methyase